MNSALSHKFWGRYTGAEWFCLKASFVWYWLKVIKPTFLNTEHIAYPRGICSLFDCSFLLSANTTHYFYVAALVLSVFYLFERWMKVTTFLMFLLSLLLFTLEESNGIENRSALFTLIPLAQFIAYWRGGNDLKKDRIQFAVQMVAAAYFMAGFSKLSASGLHWITDAPQVSIQILKGYAYSYLDHGNTADMQQGMERAAFVLQNKTLVILLFAFSLVLECTAWMAMFSKRNAFIYGCLLIGMHIGINYFMNILIEAIYYPMLIVLVNPLYVGYFVLRELYDWVQLKVEELTMA